MQIVSGEGFTLARANWYNTEGIAPESFEAGGEYFAEIEDSGLVRSRVSGDRCFYSITPEGRQTLKMFRTELGAEIRQQADDFLRAEGTVLRGDQSVRADCVPAENGMYNAVLKVLEKGSSVLEIRIQVPDKSLAEEICRKWQVKNEMIYNSLIENLF